MPNVYITSSTKGLLVGQFDAETGKIDLTDTVNEVKQAQFVTKHPSKPVLYATGDIKWKSHIFTFSVNGNKLSLLDSKLTEGHDACHLVVDNQNDCVLLVNYGGPNRKGSVVVFPIDDNGNLKPHSDLIKYNGSSVRAALQDESHPSMVGLTPDKRFVLVCDFGADNINVHRLVNGKLTPHDSITLHAGAGCDYFTFHPTQPVMYVVNRLDSTLNVYQYDSGSFTEIAAKISTLPADPNEAAATSNTEFIKKGLNYPSECHVHPSGKFLYVANRGHNSIAIYDIDAETGNIKLNGHQSTLGDWCNSFAIDPSGEYMLVANMMSDALVTLKIDADTGKLSETGHSISVSVPRCVVV